MSQLSTYKTTRSDPGKEVLFDWSLKYNNMIDAFGGANTYFTHGSGLICKDGVDFDTGQTNDVIKWVHDGTNWFMASYHDNVA